MSEADPTDPAWILSQLEAACREFRQGSFSDGLSMTETTRDQLAAALEGPVDPIEVPEDTEE